MFHWYKVQNCNSKHNHKKKIFRVKLFWGPWYKPGLMFHWNKARNCNGKNIRVHYEQDVEESKYYHMNEDQTSFSYNLSNCNIFMWNLDYLCCRSKTKKKWRCWDVVLGKASVHPLDSQKGQLKLVLLALQFEIGPAWYWRKNQTLQCKNYCKTTISVFLS